LEIEQPQDRSFTILVTAYQHSLAALP